MNDQIKAQKLQAVLFGVKKIWVKKVAEVALENTEE